MKPVVKVLVVVIVVLVTVQILKHWMDREESEVAVDTYIPWIHQEFETVPPAAFAVTPSALTVNDALTATPAPLMVTSTPFPVLTQVATDMPAVSPTMVPTFMPTFAPGMVTLRPDTVLA